MSTIRGRYGVTVHIWSTFPYYPHTAQSICCGGPTPAECCHHEVINYINEKLKAWSSNRSPAHRAAEEPSWRTIYRWIYEISCERKSESSAAQGEKPRQGNAMENTVRASRSANGTDPAGKKPTLGSDTVVSGQGKKQGLLRHSWRNAAPFILPLKFLTEGHGDHENAIVLCAFRLPPQLVQRSL